MLGMNRLSVPNIMYFAVYELRGGGKAWVKGGVALGYEHLCQKYRIVAAQIASNLTYSLVQHIL